MAGYVRGTGDAAAVLYPGPGPVLHLGFPFESIDSAPARAAVMQRAVELLLSG